MGEPPVCVFITVEPNTSPPGTKKLVPTVRSSSKRIPPPSSTGNESNASTAVVNHAQHVSEIGRASCRERVEISVVAVSVKEKKRQVETTVEDGSRGMV